MTHASHTSLDLDAWCRQTGMRNRDLADLLAVPTGTASRYRTGQRRPTDAMMDRILDMTAGAVTPTAMHKARMRRLRGAT